MIPLRLQYGETSHCKNASSFCGFFSQLHHCNMNSSGQCPFCSGEETCLHLFITYQQSSSFWSFTNIDLRSLPLSEGIESFWQITRIRMTVLLCITWNAWKCRNANIFRHEDEANTHISRRGRDDLHFFSFGPIDVVTPWSNKLLERSNFSRYYFVSVLWYFFSGCLITTIFFIRITLQDFQSVLLIWLSKQYNEPSK